MAKGTGKRARVLLVNPNYRKVYRYVSEESTMIEPPLGLAYIAAFLRQNSIEVRILDAAALNLENSEIRKYADEFQPDIIGISAATNTIVLAYEIANAVKKSSITIVVGGPHTSILPEQSLRECSTIDIAVKGEGEHVMLEIARGKTLASIEGITYRKNGKIIRNKDREFIKNLDELPFPARDLLPLGKYYSIGIRHYPFATMITSRGCPYNCNFCLSPDNKVITKDGIKEIRSLKVGDEVLTHTGELKKVTRVFERLYSGKILSITPFYSNKEIKITPNHKIYSFKKNFLKKICKHIGNRNCRGHSNFCSICSNKEYLKYKPKLTKADELKREDYIAIPIPEYTKDVKRLKLKNFLDRVVGYHKPGRKYSKKIIDKIIFLRKKGFSTRETAKRLRIAKSSVARYLKYGSVSEYPINLIEKNGKIKYKRGKKGVDCIIRLDKDFMRLCGYYLAEGHTTINKYRPNSTTLGFTFNKNETKYINDVNRLIKKVFNLQPQISKKETSCQLLLNNSIVANLFLKLFGKNAYNKKLPAEFLYLPKNKQEELLKGYLRGDSSKNNYNITVSTTSKILAEQIFFICLRFKIIPSFYIHKKEAIKVSKRSDGGYIKAKHDKNELVFRGKNAERIYFLLNIKNPYKKIKSYKSAIVTKDFILIPIKKIRKKEYNGNVYNLSVSEDTSYTANYFAVSNCVNYTVLGKGFRKRSVENVMQEIDELAKKYHVREIDIIDDNFTVDMGRAEEICDGIIKRKYDLAWKLGNGIRADRVNENLIRKMKQAGCYLIAFGIESGNENVLRGIDKGESLKQIEQAVRWCKKYGIETEGFFIIGNLNDNKKTMQDTIDFAKKLDLDIAQFQVFIPLPGSSYEKIIKAEGSIFAKSWRDYNAFSKPIFEHRELTPGLMEEMQKKAYKEFYFRPKMIARKLLEIRSMKQFASYLKAGLGILRLG